MTAWRKGLVILGYMYAGVACASGAILCLLLRLVPVAAAEREKWTRRMIHRLCAGLVAYLRFVRVLEVDFGALPELGPRRGVIIAANHPTFIDAVLIMSRVPDVFCLTKAGVLRNPWIAGMVQCAGYESNIEPGRLVEHCARRLRQGETLLVFPEGTRTTEPPVGRFKRGFAVIAACTPAPVITVLVASGNGPFLRRGEPFLAMPREFPLRYRFAVSREFVPEPEKSSREFGAKIEDHFRAALSSFS